MQSDEIKIISISISNIYHLCWKNVQYPPSGSSKLLITVNQSSYSATEPQDSFFLSSFNYICFNKSLPILRVLPTLLSLQQPLFFFLLLLHQLCFVSTSENIGCLSSCSWLISFNMTSSPIYVAANDRISFIFMAEQYFIVYMYHISLSIHLIMDTG